MVALNQLITRSPLFGNANILFTSITEENLKIVEAGAPRGTLSGKLTPLVLESLLVVLGADFRAIRAVFRRLLR